MLAPWIWHNILIGLVGGAIALGLTVGLGLTVHSGTTIIPEPESYAVAATGGAVGAIVICYAIRTRFGI